MLWLLYLIYQEYELPGVVLGPNPAETIVDYLGACTIRVLLGVLSISPIARMFNWPQVVQVRRLVGLWAFFYAMLHFSGYFLFLSELSINAFLQDFVERPYITVGILALVLMLPLAITSTRKWRLRLGPSWKTIHKLIYICAIAGWFHLLWVGKGSTFDAVLYGVLLSLLLLERLKNMLNKKRLS